MSSADRRPWLILSLSEAQALQMAALESLERNGGRGMSAPSKDLERALRVVDAQIRWIHGAWDGEEPTTEAALQREGFHHGG